MQLDFPPALNNHKRSILTAAATRLAAEHGTALLGFVLSGSAGRGLDTPRSDLDLLVVLEPAVVDGPRAPWLQTPELEQIPLTLEHLETTADFGDAQWGYRWSYAWAPTLADSTGGRIAAAIDRQTHLAQAETISILVAHRRLDEWINQLYRALKSARDGHELEATLDTSESIPAFLDITFALNGLVRPYNKYLQWALQTHPIADWSTPDLLAMIRHMLAGNPEALRRSLTHVRKTALQYDHLHGQGVLRTIIDDWSSEQYAVLQASG